MEPAEWGQPDERPYGAEGSHGGMRGDQCGGWGGWSIQEECVHSQGAKADSSGGRVLCLREVGLSPAGQKNWRLSPLQPSALGTPCLSLL